MGQIASTEISATLSGALSGSIQSAILLVPIVDGPGWER